MDGLWFNWMILHWDNIKLFAPDTCETYLLSISYKFFILHSAKAYLGPFQTSMMELQLYQMMAWKHHFRVTYGKIPSNQS